MTRVSKLHYIEHNSLKFKLKRTVYETDKEEHTFGRILGTDGIHFPHTLSIVLREESHHFLQSFKCLMKNSALALFA